MTACRLFTILYTIKRIYSDYCVLFHTRFGLQLCVFLPCFFLYCYKNRENVTDEWHSKGQGFDSPMLHHLRGDKNRLSILNKMVELHRLFVAMPSVYTRNSQLSYDSLPSSRFAQKRIFTHFDAFARPGSSQKVVRGSQQVVRK